MLAVAVRGALWFVTNRYSGNIERVGQVFDGLAPRPAQPPIPPTGDAASATADPVTFPLVGSDTHAEVAPEELPDARSDAIMIARFSADRVHAQVVCILRGSWVDVPATARTRSTPPTPSGAPLSWSRP